MRDIDEARVRSELAPIENGLLVLRPGPFGQLRTEAMDGEIREVWAAYEAFCTEPN